MLSNKPYLLRAFYQWITDSACTPILVLDALNPKCKIPKDFADGGEIVFNVSTVAVRDFKLTNEGVEFKASFSGVIHIISAPIKAILALYAEENGEGIFLDADEDDETVNPADVVQIQNREGSFSNTITEQVASVVDAVLPSEKGKPILTVVE